MPQQPPLAPQEERAIVCAGVWSFSCGPQCLVLVRMEHQISHRREELVVSLTKTLHPRSDLILHAIHEQNSADSIVYALRALGQYHGRTLHLSPTKSVESCYTRLWADRHAPEYTRTDPGL